MPVEDVTDWIALNMIPGVGGSVFKRLVDSFGSPKAVLSASRKELGRIRGLTPLVCQAIEEYRDRVPIERELDLIQKHNVKVITIRDDSYPANLKAIYDPPQVLYVKGEILPGDSFSVSVVGTRTASAYGKMAAERLSKQLASRGITIVSGMAYGVDTAAHKGALEAGGRTIAIVGNGVDIVYPSGNVGLCEEIVKSGAVVSEFAMSSPPLRGNFPRRNRLISGIALGTLVVEAPERSGALLTADFALEQGREVFAVPGQIFSEVSKGTNNLIKQGAKLIQSVDDIIDELPNRLGEKPGTEDNTWKDEQIESQLAGDEKAVWKAISASPIHIDDVSKVAGLPSYKVSVSLVTLELKGLIRQLPGKMFARKVRTSAE